MSFFAEYQAAEIYRPITKLKENIMSNTKLTDFEKIDLKEMKHDAAIEGVQVITVDNRTVMAYKVQGNTVEFSLAVKSPDEKKFRRKVGEYYALHRFNIGNTVKMAKDDFESMCANNWEAYPIE